MSAPSYFHALKRRFGLSTASVEVVGSGGHSQPVQVVRRAVDRQAASADPDSGTEPFDEVWCVIDGDYGSKINNARTSAVVHGVELAISTPCFEYWILLHFEASAVPAAKCDVVVHSLKERHLPDYEKGACDFDSMLEHVHDACARAKRLREPGIKRGEAPRTRTHAARSTGW